jgi:hypothetical protein
MIMIITGVANPGGRAASLNRFAKCSGWTKRLKEPWLPGYLSHGLVSQSRGDEPRAGPDLLLEAGIAINH